MLLVKTVVKTSTISGIGLFADEDIPVGTRTWKLSFATCLLFTREQFESFCTSYHKTAGAVDDFLSYTYYLQSIDRVVFCLDNARFTNHSETPSLCTSQEKDPETGVEYTIAMRDIQKGEELTEDYNGFDDYQWLDDRCKERGIFYGRRA